MLLFLILWKVVFMVIQMLVLKLFLLIVVEILCIIAQICILEESRIVLIPQAPIRREDFFPNHSEQSYSCLNAIDCDVEYINPEKELYDDRPSF